MQIVWAKAGNRIWGLGHVFEGKLYFTKDIVDDSLSQGIGSRATFVLTIGTY